MLLAHPQAQRHPLTAVAPDRTGAAPIAAPGDEVFLFVDGR